MWRLLECIGIEIILEVARYAEDYLLTHMRYDCLDITVVLTAAMPVKAVGFILGRADSLLVASL